MITKIKAVKIAIGCFKPNKDNFTVYSKKPKTFHCYKFRDKNDPCWYIVYNKPRNSSYMIRSSTVIIISKKTGKILFRGSAGNEG
ncbi:MAG: hypothetical protein PHE88_00830 [Elusimicrobia bacterium]|nr:hypothetical protein [Elusimicrobiota bacterium]